jgi:hypothetical protein
MKKNRFVSSFQYVALIIPTTFLFACSGDPEHADATATDSSEININEQVTTAETVFNYMPSPIETADLLKKSGAEYDGRLLNDPTAVNNYTSSSAQALNLGIYGADLSFAGIFDQHSEAMLYLTAARKLADQLHVGNAFGEGTRKRLEANVNNRDSILSVISDAYWDCDATFKENQMRETSVLMIAGGWIEGLYLACKVAEKTNNNDIRVRIVEQRYSLESLIGMLEKTQEKPAVVPVLKDLKALKAIFDALPKPASQAISTNTDDKSGVTTIGGDEPVPAVSMNALEFSRILEKVTTIRQAMIAAH